MLQTQPESAGISQQFQRITIVSVTGLPDASSAVNSLILSQRQMPGARVLLCCPTAPDNLPKSIEHRAIAPMNYQEYGWFIMFALWRVIETDYALIIQDDGWVLDSSNWGDDFFEYDYIGPTTHAARVDTAQGSCLLNAYRWNHELGKPGVTVYPILNGGFSLRSRHMLRALIDHPEVQVRIPPPAVVGDPLKMNWDGVINEDTLLTATLRPEFEAVGIKYAPIEACLRFGMENAGFINHETNMMKLFGHHAPWRRLISIDPPIVRYTAREWIHIFRENDFIRMLEHRGYRVEIPPE